MKPSQAQLLIEELRKKLNHHTTEYYQLGESKIDDNEFDIMLEQLIDLETEFSEFRHADSPSQRVGGSSIDAFNSVKHDLPMLSLSNLYTKEELGTWYNTVKTHFPTEEVLISCELKIDGVAMSIKYVNGQFIRAVTRGNGEVGDDVSPNIRTVRSLPLDLNPPLSFEVRGEIYLSHKQFQLINQYKKHQGEELFKNPRNAAAGTLRIKDPKMVANRNLDIILYDLVEGHHSQKHSENLKYLESLGLPVSPYLQVCKSLQEIENFCDKWEREKTNLPFDIDGVVIKVEKLGQRLVLGTTAKSPRWATAWKFKTERAKSRLLSIENSIGRTGILTPVANLEPVELLGTEVKRATLHNYDQVNRLGIHEHDYLFVEKGGEIIPKIVGVDYTQRPEDSTPVTAPSHCPVCSTLLVKDEQEVDLRCENSTCPAIVEGALGHFVSKKGMDIKFLGQAIVSQLISEKFILDIPDIYRLHIKRSDLLKLEGMGEKSINNLLGAIEISKKIPFHQFLYALGIRHIGEKAAKSISVKVKSLQQFLEITEEDLENLPDFGVIMVNSLIRWIQNPSYRNIIQELIELGVVPTAMEAQENQPFVGQSIVITGTLSKPRNEWKVILEKVGFRVSAAVSKKTNYLLLGKEAGSKKNKAEKLGIEILSEEGLENLLKEKTL